MYSSDAINGLNSTNLTGSLRREFQIYQPQETKRGNKIVDVAYYKQPDGSYGIDLTIRDYNENVIHLYYEKPDELPLSDQYYIRQIERLKETISKLYGGADISSLEQDLAKAEQMLSNLYNADKISLNTLEATTKEAGMAGLNINDVDFYIYIPGDSDVDVNKGKEPEKKDIEQEESVTPINPILANYEPEPQKDPYEEIGIDPNALGSDNTNTISGNKGVTSNYTFNQIIGENCDYYKILKTSGGELSLIGFKNGEPVRIDNSLLKQNKLSNPSITMLNDDGSIADKGLVACYKIGVTDQYIGLYMDGNKINVCYARGGNDNLIGKSISESSINSTNGADISSKLDIARNDNLAPEDKTAGYVSNSKNIGANSSPSNRDYLEIVTATANAYDIDANNLQNEFENVRAKYPNMSDQDVAELIAQEQKEAELIAQQQKKDGDLHEPDEPELGGEPDRPPLF